MPVLDRSNYNSPAGWVDKDTGGVVEYGEDFEGHRAGLIVRVGDPAWNDLGRWRRRKQVAVAGDTIKVNYYFAGAQTDFLFGIRRLADLELSSTTGIYNNGSGGLYLIENGQTPGPNLAPTNVGWYPFLFNFKNSGTVELFIDNGGLQSFGETAATDWIGKDVWYSENCHKHGQQDGTHTDDLLWERA